MTSRNLRDWAVATVIAWLVVSAAFFVHRNREFRAREEGRARAAALAVARGEEPIGGVDTATATPWPFCCAATTRPEPAGQKIPNAPS